MYICNERPMYISQIAVFTYSTQASGNIYQRNKHLDRASFQIIKVYIGKIQTNGEMREIINDYTYKLISDK